jgi:hypothetical protein
MNAVRRAHPLLNLLPFVVVLSACQSGAGLPEPCNKPPESGKCRAAIERFYFDQNLAQCRAFIWGGCDGVVPFTTLEACQAQCEIISENEPKGASTGEKND